MNRKELAALLGVTPGMVTRYAQRGMPTDSVERAQRWRKRHLEPSRRKENRFDPTAPAVRPPPPAPPQPDASMQELHHWQRTAAQAVQALADVLVWLTPQDDTHAPTVTNLRACLHTAPAGFQPRMALAALLALVDYVLGDNNPARYTTDQLDLLDPDEFAMLAGGHSTGTEWLRLAASDPPDDWDEWSDNDDC